MLHLDSDRPQRSIRLHANNMPIFLMLKNHAEAGFDTWGRITTGRRALWLGSPEAYFTKENIPSEARPESLNQMTAYMIRYAPRSSWRPRDHRPIPYCWELEPSIHLLVTFPSSFDQRLVDRFGGGMFQWHPVVAMLQMSSFMVLVGASVEDNKPWCCAALGDELRVQGLSSIARAEELPESCSGVYRPGQSAYIDRATLDLDGQLKVHVSIKRCAKRPLSEPALVSQWSFGRNSASAFLSVQDMNRHAYLLPVRVEGNIA